MRFEEGFRADIIVEGKVILELKSMEQLSKGMERVVNGLPEESLGVLASWRDIPIEAEPSTSPNAAPRHR